MSKKKKNREQEPPEVDETEVDETEVDETEAEQAEPAEVEEEVKAPAAEAEAVEPDPLAEMQIERDDYKDRWLRIVAELDNFRKRSRKEVADSRRFAVADCLRDLLEVLDNFERAEAALPEDGGDGESLASFREGMDLVHGRLNEILSARGLVRIAAGPGTVFDPNLHEAVMQIESEDYESGEITDVAQAGYRMGDLVLRPSRVVVAR